MQKREVCHVQTDCAAYLWCLAMFLEVNCRPFLSSCWLIKVSATNLALSLKIRALSYASFYFLVLLCMLSLFGISDSPFSVTNHSAVQSTAGILVATKRDSFRPDQLADDRGSLPFSVYEYTWNHCLLQRRVQSI